MMNHLRFANYTGAVAVASTLAPGEAFKLIEVRVHLSAAGGAGNLTITADAVRGSAYDILLKTQDMTAVADLVWYPERAMHFEAGDELDIAWANAGGKTYGITVVYELI